MSINPLFTHLMDKYRELHAAGLAHTEEASNLFAEAMQYAPEQFKNLVHDTAVEMGLMPATPDAYSDEGEPLYFLEGIAERLGVDMSDIPDRFKELSHTGAIHRTH